MFARRWLAAPQSPHVQDGSQQRHQDQPPLGQRRDRGHCTGSESCHQHRGKRIGDLAQGWVVVAHIVVDNCVGHRIARNTRPASQSGSPASHSAWPRCSRPTGGKAEHPQRKLHAARMRPGAKRGRGDGAACRSGQLHPVHPPATGQRERARRYRRVQGVGRGWLIVGISRIGRGDGIRSHQQPTGRATENRSRERPSAPGQAPPPAPSKESQYGRQHSQCPRRIHWDAYRTATQRASC